MIKNERQAEDVIQNWRIRRLFRAVLVLAAKDAYMTRSKRPSKIKERDEALSFFKNMSDLKIICGLAGADFEAIWAITSKDIGKNKEKYNKIILRVFKNASLFY